MDVHEWPYQSQRKKFEKVMRKKFIECELLQMKLKTAQKEKSEIKQQLEQLLKIQENKGIRRYNTHVYLIFSRSVA